MVSGANPSFCRRVGHFLSDHDVDFGGTERPVAKRPQRCACGSAEAAADVERLGDLREDILQPVDEMGASQLRNESHGNREERGVGLGDDDVALSCHSPRVPRRRDVKGQVVDAPTLKAQSAAL